MQILIDAASCPGSVADICRASGKAVKVIRERSADLYRQSSGEFDAERQAEDEQAEALVGTAGRGDILVTKDLDLARRLIGTVTAVLHPNGFVYNPRSIMLLSYENFIAEQNRAAGQKSGEKIKMRDPKLDSSFEETLHGFIDPV